MTPRDAGLGIWKDESVWFSSSVQSRKVRNLRADPRCVVTTDDPIKPVVVEGVAEVLRDLTAIEEMVSRVNEKYSSKVTLEFMDPDVNATFRVRPRWVFSLNDKAFYRVPHPLGVRRSPSLMAATCWSGAGGVEWRP